MKFRLPYIPERTEKPREHGITMMMDKGLGPKQVEAFIEASGKYTDVVKLGFGSSYFSDHLEEKIRLYQEAGIHPYLGGTFFEAFIARDMFEDYRKLLDELGLGMAEVSDGSVIIPHEKKCEYISTLSEQVTVLSEVGSKEEGILISPGKWINMMLSELDAGSWKVIAEARESGNVGIYRPNGTAHTVLVNKIIRQVPQEKILWETPKKPQQVWFIDLLGANANLGNIGHDDVIPLETLRCGLRGDTFFNYLPTEVIEKIS
jgi:phosphosulfolactate synthase